MAGAAAANGNCYRDRFADANEDSLTDSDQGDDPNTQPHRSCDGDRALAMHHDGGHRRRHHPGKVPAVQR